MGKHDEWRGHDSGLRTMSGEDPLNPEPFTRAARPHTPAPDTDIFKEIGELHDEIPNNNLTWEEIMGSLEDIAEHSKEHDAAIERAATLEERERILGCWIKCLQENDSDISPEGYIGHTNCIKSLRQSADNGREG
jgi:hypothetical protein